MGKQTFITAKGFTLVELLAVIVLIGVLGAIVTSRLSSPSVFELQSSRDQLVAAFRSAQQLAMVQTDPVRFSTRDNQLQIIQDSNRDGVFSQVENITFDGIQYPLALDSNQVISAVDIDFDRLGRSASSAINLSQGSISVNVVVSSMGHIE